MYPLLNLLGGVALGVIGVKMGQRHLPGRTARANAVVRGAASRMGRELRDATASGLGVIEKGAGGLRERIEVAPEPVADPVAAPKPKARRAPRKISAAKTNSTK